MVDLVKPLHDAAHSVEVKKLGILALAALRVFTDGAIQVANKSAPFLAFTDLDEKLKALGDDHIQIFVDRLQHLIDRQEARAEDKSVQAVIENAPEAAAVVAE